MALNRLQTNNHRPSVNHAKHTHNNQCTNNHNITLTTTNKNIYMVVPYTKGLSKSFKNFCGKVGLQVHFQGDNTIKNLPVAPKDKDNITKKSREIDRYKCDQVDCMEEYIEAARTLGDRPKKHLRALPHL